MLFAFAFLFLVVSGVHGVDWGSGNKISAALIARKSGYSITFGDPARGGNSTAVKDDIGYNIRYINSTYGAFSALLYDGTVRCWGDADYGGDTSLVEDQLQNVVEISATGHAFAGRKQDGSVVAWGSPDFGGDTSSVDDYLVEIAHIYSNELTFAAVTKNRTTIVTWGAYASDYDDVAVSITSPVLHIYSTRLAFAALMDGGGVVTWGQGSSGSLPTNQFQSYIDAGVVHIATSMHAFAALKGDGSVIAWGEPAYGGDASGVYQWLASGVKRLASTDYAFAALKQDDYSYDWVLITWGNSLYGGYASASVHTALVSGVNEIISSSFAFAVITYGGRVVVWGDDENLSNFAAVESNLQNSVQKIVATERAFAAVNYVYPCQCYKILSWGPEMYGGNSSDIPSGYLYSFAATSRAFAAVINGPNVGNVVYSWGDPMYGGNTSTGAIRAELDNGYYDKVLGSSLYDQNHFTYPLPSQAPVPYPTEMPVNEPTNAPITDDDGGQLLNYAPTYTITNGFAFLLYDTATYKVYSWGEAGYGGNISTSTVRAPLTVHAYSLFAASRFAYATVLPDHTVLSWGAESSTVNAPTHVFDSYTAVLYANEAAFVAHDPITHGLYTFGSKHSGGVYNHSAWCTVPDCKQIGQIFASACAFAGTTYYNGVYGLFAWGNRNCGGEVPEYILQAVAAEGGVNTIIPGREGFVVITYNGGVYGWGSSSIVPSVDVRAQLQTGLYMIVATRSAFIAYKNDRSVVIWGYGPYGADTSSVDTYLARGVKLVVFTFTAMAALLTDETVVAWGRASGGGDTTGVHESLVNIVSIKANSKAFAAVNTDGKVITWGKAEYGGVIPLDKQSQLECCVSKIYSTDRAFAALKYSGELVVWGQAGHGGDPSLEVQALLAVGVHTVCSNDVAFSAVTYEGKVVAWGHAVSVPVPGVVWSSDDLNGANTVVCK